MYKVIHYFTDLQDNGYAYEAGAEYPRSGKQVTEERIAELSGSDNLQKKPLIEEVKEEKAETAGEKPKRTRRKKAAKEE